MGATTRIPWCDHTFNPWIGCTKVSAGCLHCYAEREQAIRFGRVKWGKGQPRHRTSAAYWAQPLRWDRSSEARSQLFGNIPWARRAIASSTHRPRVFCASLADWLDDEVPIAWLADLLDLIRRTPHLDWLLLTKRPQNWRDRLQLVLSHCEPIDGELAAWVFAWLNDHAPSNVWGGTTVEDQQRADARIPELRKIPARVRFLSCEPLLGSVDLHSPAIKGDTWRVGESFDGPVALDGIHWVIIGGESGPEARKFCLDHALDVVDQCGRAGVPVFVKQLGAYPVTTNANLYDWPDDTTLEAYGIAAAGARVILRDRNGRDLAEWPEQLQLQEFPNDGD